MLLVLQEALMTNPRDVIYVAIHSAFVKYPREDDPHRMIIGFSRRKPGI
jgi:hypothetical protein